MTIPEAFQIALQHHQSGRLAEAEAIYQQILAVAPQHADSVHLLGVIAQQSGRRDVALELVRRAIQLNCAQPVYHANLAVIFRSFGLLDDAIGCYQRILELNPASDEARRNLQLMRSHRHWNATRAEGRPAASPEALDSWLAQASDIGMLQVPDEIREFCAFLRDQDLNHVMEIGSHRGGTFFLLCRLARGKKIALDLPGGSFGGLDRANAEARNLAMEKWAPQVLPLSGDSLDLKTRDQVAHALGADRLDLLFIDGNHTYEGVKADYELYKPFVRPGGYIAFHDIVDSAQHRSVGCFVAKLWNELSGDKIEFNAGHEWAGIGVIRTSSG